jgi:hypothetical protein
MRDRQLLVVAFVALLLGGAFIGVLAAVGDDPRPAPLARGFTTDEEELRKAADRNAEGIWAAATDVFVRGLAELSPRSVGDGFPDDFPDLPSGPDVDEDGGDDDGDGADVGAGGP